MARPEQFSLAWLIGEMTLAALVLGGIRMMPAPIGETGPAQVIGLSMAIIATGGFVGGLFRRTTTGQIAGAVVGIACLLGLALLTLLASLLPWT